VRNVDTQAKPRPAQMATREIRIATGFTAVVLFGVVLFHALCFRSVVHDFTSFYTGAYIVRHGNGARLYDVYEQARVQSGLFGWKGLFMDNHPPFEALLMSPLGGLSYAWAFIVWGGINIGFWISFVYLVRPYVRVPSQAFQYLILCFTFFPLWIALMQGQTSLLLLLLFALTFISVKRRRDFTAGLFLALALVKFPVVLPFALIFVLRGKWRMIAGFGLTTALLGILSVITVGPAGLVSYVHLLHNELRHPANSGSAINVHDMPNVRGFLSEFFRRGAAARAAGVASATISLCLILWTAWVWRRRGADDRGASFDLFFAAALMIAEVASPHTLVHDVSPALLAILLVVSAPQMAEKSPWRLMVRLSIAALYTVPAFAFVLGREPDLGFLALAIIAFAVGALELAGSPMPTPPPETDRSEANPLSARCVNGNTPGKPMSTFWHTSRVVKHPAGNLSRVSFR
jgi:hypothetical protein